MLCGLRCYANASVRMPLKTLQITQWRNLQSVSLDCSPTLNILCGDNGSGKTSLLEAIYFLGSGRSFRTTKTQRLVTDGANSAILFSETDYGVRFGLEKKTSGETRAHLNGFPVKRLLDVAQHVPVQLLDPSMMELLSGPSLLRRQMIDWAVFHVKPAVADLYARYNRALSQRNSLLKNAKMQPQEVSFWNDELVSSAESINVLRDDVIREWTPIFADEINAALPNFDFSLEFSPGWEVKIGLRQVLQDSLAADYERGFTFYGAHRADLKLKSEGRLAADYLSRGQMKLCVCFSKLTLLKYLESKQVTPILLLDDIASELDERSLSLVLKKLFELKSQIWLTAIDGSSLEDKSLPEDKKVFHMKHGLIEA